MEHTKVEKAFIEARITIAIFRKLSVSLENCLKMIKGLFQKLENSNYTSKAKNSPVIKEVLRNILVKKCEKIFDPY